LSETEKGPLDARERTLTLQGSGRAWWLGRTARMTSLQSQRSPGECLVVGMAKSSGTRRALGRSEYIKYGSTCIASMISYLAYHITFQTA